jgi:acetyltransferase-like isoleucine patch superfamily enzyme
MRHAGSGAFGRMATRLAMWRVPPHYARKYLARMNPRGFISPDATIYHNDLRLGANVFIDDGVLVFQGQHGGKVELSDRASVMRDVILQTGHGGSITIGTGSGIHPRCQITAIVEPIEIGSGVGVAANCALYSYDHGFAPDEDIFKQPCRSRGAIIIGDGAWLGTGVIVLSGVRIGKGAVIGAGSVVTRDIPDGAVAAGTPARVLKMRDELRPAEVGADLGKGR